MKSEIIKRKEMDEILKKDDWELEYLVRHKQNPNYYPLDREKFKQCVMENLRHCESGMYIGENYHGGMSREEWKSNYDYYKVVLKELEGDDI